MYGKSCLRMDCLDIHVQSCFSNTDFDGFSFILSQELHREYVTAEREQKHELSVRQKQQELEDKVMQGLARTEQEREQQARKVK